VGDGKTIYDHPETAFVASFVGEANRFAGPVTQAADGWAVLDTAYGPLRGRNPRGLAAGDRATLFVRPERLAPGESDNSLTARVSHSDFEGAFVNAFLDGGLTVQMPHLGQEPAFVPGQTARLGFRAADAVVLPTN
ncbi:TOBE domain-containing protein, partial [Azospirillum sp. B506]|uniref:TOBE domain-containing protein n=1 Tax=Azospirillum sp. B506 TaxID=137721 RepID=UPI0005B2931E